MNIRPFRDIVRRPSRQVHVGSIAVGGDAPISVQSMTNTPTADVAATVAQVRDLEDEARLARLVLGELSRRDEVLALQVLD